MLIFRLLGFILLCLFTMTSCQEEATLFHLVDSAKSGIDFANSIVENDSLNILANEYVYNGAGVAIADVNNDGLADLFFSGNQVDNKLYINQGNLTFKNVTLSAGLKKANPSLWSSGVNIIDINYDGLLDIYVCNTMNKVADNRKNLLYINTGLDANNEPKFIESASAYGLDSDTYSSHAQFFDFDNDGDLDVFIGVNQIYNNNPNQYADPIIGIEAISRDRLLKNNWSEELGHPIFEDVSISANIKHNGYSHSTLIHDFNKDGWADIYVANDYISNDLVFINNKDGTFENKANEIFKHFSLSAMGSDLGDVNNDGKTDFIVSEMQPYYNKRKKLFHGESSYTTELLRVKYNHDVQYTRNTLQLNRGINPVNQLPIFSDIGILSGVQETDWSWATLFADYDNDGWQDIFIANGFPKDVTDRDFSEFRAFANRLVSNEKLLSAIPEVKSPNFMFKNNGNLIFENMSKEWGLDVPSFSNGAAYGDLDNDGDLDLVTNNINDFAFICENKSADNSHNFLRVKLKGRDKNTAALGASVVCFVNGNKQIRSILSSRGYLSQSESILHFGLAESESIDSLVINWPDGYNQHLTDVNVNELLIVDYNEELTNQPNISANFDKMFKDVSNSTQILHLDEDPDFIDFNIQRTIPHKLSQYGPALAVGDVNGDNLDDLFVGAGFEQDQTWFFQNSDFTFSEKKVTYKSKDKKEEDAGILLFDADSDNDLDIYIVRGSAQFPDQHVLYQDVLMRNDGKGNFERDINAIPDIRSNGSCVKAADYDLDGDLDLFIGSRVKPGSYPEMGKSYLLQNESQNGKIKFRIASVEDNEHLMLAGLVSDAMWTDLNNDSWPDLILACEWSPLKIFINKQGSFKNISESSGLENYIGWWNSLKSVDIDNDGDMDFVAGNFGDNTYFSGSSEEQFKIYGKDFDNNGSIDPLLSLMWADSLGGKHEYPYHPFMDMGKQLPSMRKKFSNYGEYGEATMSKILEDENLDNSIQYAANWMKSSWIENLGDERFKMHALPIEAQLSAVYGIQTIDVNDDTHLDILLVGNDFGVEVQQGRADAFNGLLLKNDAVGNMVVSSLEESHFFVPGDAKSLVKLNTPNHKSVFIASQNKDSLKVLEFKHIEEQQLIRLTNDEVKCEIEYSDNSRQMNEFYWGDSFQSQSSRTILVNPMMQKMKFYNNLGKETRVLNF